MHKTEIEKKKSLKSYKEAMSIIEDLFERTEKSDLEKAMNICGIGQCENCEEKGKYFREGEITGQEQAEERQQEDEHREYVRVTQIFDNIKKEIESYEK